MQERTVAELVGRARRGDRPAFDELVRRHLRAAYAVAFAALRNRSEAEDVAQEAFVRALAKLDTCRDPARFSGWLVQIVRRRASSFLARRAVRERREAAAAEPVGRTEDLTLRRELVAALEALSATQREVVLLHDLEGLTHAEISVALDLSEVNSRQLLFTARQTLRGFLRKQA